MRVRELAVLCVITIGPGLGLPAIGSASDWANWRGPVRQGTSDATGLISSWSKEGENLLWRHDFTGRSTPVVFQGRVCANGRVGEGINRQEMIACFDADRGEKLWEFRYNVYQTTVPWTRVGWANPVADPETGYVYVQSVGGSFFCLDSRDGKVIWQRNFIEEFGFMEGYGGRTQTPTIDEDRLIVTFASTSWGSQARPLHRSWAFDKRSGELLWSSTPPNSMSDKNSQSTPSIAMINGQRLVIHGNGDGSIFALQARTGKKIWQFGLSKRGINTSVLVDGNTVFAAHSEENIDEGSMGRVVAIDATGSGDVTQSHEKWRASLGVGYSSPVFKDGKLFVLDNSANLHALNGETGEEVFEINVGTVGKSSPVIADGKIYLTEVNGNFVILEMSADSASTLDTEELTVSNGRYAEIYGSPAIAYGRIYFTTEEGIYCLGDPSKTFQAIAAKPMVLAEEAPEANAAATMLLVMPADTEISSADAAEFRVEAFDALGRSLGARSAGWSLDGIAGTVEDGVVWPSADAGSQAGRVKARVGELEASARLRVLAPFPVSEDFESTDLESRPDYFLGYVGRFAVKDLDGNKVLFKGPSPRKIHRHITFVGSHSDSGYTVEADVMGTQDGRKRPDVGLLNNGYTLDLMGNHQRLEVRSWASALRMVSREDFAWDADTWYRMKMRVDVDDDKAVIRGKVWPKGGPEPTDWQITAEDPLPIRTGSAGLYGYSPTPVYYDNLRVTSN